MVSAASRPPSHKTRGRGTHSFETGSKNLEPWATRPAAETASSWFGLAKLGYDIGAFGYAYGFQCK